jgi:hypothetical protein
MNEIYYTHIKKIIYIINESECFFFILIKTLHI